MGLQHLINGTRGFFSDIGKVFRGEMGMEEFLRRKSSSHNVGAPFILIFTRIGVVHQLRWEEFYIAVFQKSYCNSTNSF